MSNNLIKISKDYNGLWLGQEITVNPDQDKKEQWRKAEQEMDSYFHSRGSDWQQNGLQPSQNIESKSPPIINLAAEKVEIAIENANDIQDLNALWEKAVEHQLTTEWQRKYNQLHDIDSD